MAEMKSISFTERLFPILKIRYGAEEPAESGFKGFQSGLPVGTQRRTWEIPSTISSTYVKSLSIFPSLKTSIGFPSRIALVKINKAISGLPQGPYTVKKRKPEVGMPNK